MRDSIAAQPAPATPVSSAPLIGFSSGNMHRIPSPAMAPVGSRELMARATNGATAAATFTVRPGQSIQAAIDRCQAGDRVEIEPGIYQQSLLIDRDGISVVGVVRRGERPVLDGGGVLADAVQASGNDLLITGLTLRNYKGNGIAVSKARGVVLRDLVVQATGLYGLYPVECIGVLVESCTVSGMCDAGVYVGSSREIVVRNNEVFHNVAGIEIENCVDAVVTNNSAHHNSTGILVFVLPNNPSKTGSDTRVVGNRAWANNHENFGKPGTTVANLPNGVGILVMAADRTDVTQNWIAENDSYGIVVVSLASAIAAKANARRRAQLGPHHDCGQRVSRQRPAAARQVWRSAQRERRRSVLGRQRRGQRVARKPQPQDVSPAASAAG